ARQGTDPRLPPDSGLSDPEPGRPPGRGAVADGGPPEGAPPAGAPPDGAPPRLADVGRVIPPHPLARAARRRSAARARSRPRRPWSAPGHPAWPGPPPPPGRWPGRAGTGPAPPAPRRRPAAR